MLTDSTLFFHHLVWDLRPVSAKSKDNVVDDWREQINSVQDYKRGAQGRKNNDRNPDTPFNDTIKTPKRKATNSDIAIIRASPVLKASKHRKQTTEDPSLEKGHHDTLGGGTGVGATFGGFDDGDDKAEREAIRLTPGKKASNVW